MIILDSCVIRSMRLHGGEADVLRAIKRTNTERVGAPWMAIEELAAQKALEYQEAHRVAARALRLLQHKSHQPEPQLDVADPEAVRQKWRSKYWGLVQELPTSDAALREGMFREANTLPPATTKGDGDKKVKVGARDVAIWLTAVEYARDHPDETVYFVSTNHKDFTKGNGAYPPPMDDDLKGLEGRFKHLANLADVLALLAPRVEVNHAEVRDLLEKKHTAYIQECVHAFPAPGLNPEGHGVWLRSFPVMTQGGTVEEASGWVWQGGLPTASFVDVSDVEAYRLGDEEYLVVSARWQVTGYALARSQVAGYTLTGSRMIMAACYWDTRLLVGMGPDAPNPQLLSPGTILPTDDATGVKWPSPDNSHVVLRQLLHRTGEDDKLTWPEALLAVGTALSMGKDNRQALVDQLRHT